MVCRHGQTQALCIGMAGAIKNVVDGASFYHLARVHYHHLVRHAGDYAQVVGNENRPVMPMVRYYNIFVFFSSRFHSFFKNKKSVSKRF